LALNAAPTLAFRGMVHTKINAVVLFCFIDKKIFQNVLPVCWGERFFADSAMNQAARKFGIRTARRRNQLAGEKMEQAADLDPVSRDEQAR